MAAALLIPNEIHSGADLFSKSGVRAIAGGKVWNSSEK
jgi:murein DD-endopeptidase MepM/ murein hydrolase activator NlpD